jgi:hypothetical protein
LRRFERGGGADFSLAPIDPAITQTRSALDYLPPLDLADDVAEFVPEAETA